MGRARYTNPRVPEGHTLVNNRRCPPPLHRLPWHHGSRRPEVDPNLDLWSEATVIQSIALVPVVHDSKILVEATTALLAWYRKRRGLRRGAESVYPTFYGTYISTYIRHRARLPSDHGSQECTVP
jgi:hypothetical protein